jgi:hypothetical protein
MRTRSTPMIFVQFKELENWHNNMFSNFFFKCFIYHASRILGGTITEEMMIYLISPLRERVP